MVVVEGARFVVVVVLGLRVVVVDVVVGLGVVVVGFTQVLTHWVRSRNLFPFPPSPLKTNSTHVLTRLS